MSDDRNARSTTVRRGLSIATLVGTALALAGALASLIFYLVALRPFEVAIWPVDEQQLFPSEATSQQALPLKLGTTDVRRLQVVKLRVENLGTEALGEPDRLWSLSLVSGDAEATVLIVAPTVVPPTTSLRVVPASSASEISLEVGRLPPFGHVDLNVMVVNAASPVYRPEIEWSLSGLVVPRVASSSPSERWAIRASPVVSLVFGLVLLFEFVREQRRRLGGFTPKALPVALGRFLVVVLLWAISSLFAGRLIAFVALAWARSGVLYVELLRYLGFMIDSPAA